MVCTGNVMNLLVTTCIPMISVDCCGKRALCGADFLENHHGETKDGTDSPSSLVSIRVLYCTDVVSTAAKVTGIYMFWCLL